jgi:hypothetical protein
VRQCAEVVVEGMVFLHNDDDVFYILQVSLRGRTPGSRQGNHQEQCHMPDSFRRIHQQAS